ncbi:MAG: cation:proton antiporter [candidate division WOR-3 bacterium]
MINVIPLSVISSSIAIPSSKGLSPYYREFVIYESSFSDILGILFFNFIVVYKIRDFLGTIIFGFEILTMIIIALIFTIFLSLLLANIEGHIKYVPIILIIVLIYAISKFFHLPSLILILIFGLLMENSYIIRQFHFINKLISEKLEEEIIKFKDLVSEFTFLAKSLFFILFGYMISTSELLNFSFISISIVIIIYIIRAIQLKLFSIDYKPLLFIAPRGLITILLYLSIPPESQTDIVNKSVIVQVIILTSLIMAIGIMSNRKL